MPKRKLHKATLKEVIALYKKRKLAHPVACAVGLCVAMVVRKYIGYLKLLEYLKWIKKVRPAIKKVVTRREFLTLNLFTFKRA